MHQKAADELDTIQGQLLPLAAASVILHLYGHGVFAHAEDAAVADCYSVRVTSEVMHHGLRSGKRLPDIRDPVFSITGIRWKELPLDGVEFVRRFLMHVPPKGFVRIRHYGILSNQNKRKLIPICRNLIGCREFLRRFRKDDKAQAIRILYKKDVTVCPCCGGSMSYEVCTGRAPKRSSA